MPKNDSYLNLCIEQAVKSPLHYRHGAIVVRGGKVIGHGYNDYRPGFNGGALKHGRIAHGTFDGDAVQELKSKLKKKDKNKQQQPSGTFVRFEGTGGGHGANQPLSMHSEMMAIYTALSASSTMSSTTFSREKPCFKLPRSDKRKARLRREVLMSFKSAVLKLPHLNQVSQEAASNHNKKEDRNYNDNKEDEYEDNALLKQVLKDTSLAFHEELSGEKHHHHQSRKQKKNGKKNEYQYQYDRYGSQTQHAQAQQQPNSSASKSRRGDDSDSYDVIRGYDATITSHDEEDNGDMTNVAGPASMPSCQAMKRKKDYKRSGKMRSKDQSDDQSGRSEPMLLPTGRSGASSAHVADRKRHPRLQGADLYVTRVGWQGKPARKPPKTKASSRAAEIEPADEADALEEALTESTSSLASLSVASSHSATGSLHDELVNRNPSPSPSDASAVDSCGFDRSKVHASRPCYRCIAFMHSVGVRRVFWTNDAGEWEGGKVAKLVEGMETSMDEVASSGNSGGPMGNGVFVTKHEVLMLRRMMGAKGMS
ncbi:hypothetical protein M409DRAFT_55635 [Zasmidium cellare ATCC 36951]|uniref:CMP/dCMP-type deaminase domain-containing protein n=1 Tax=Zasmidium cellare ATCC 36951 TaxID=1080233 RepID=A0A6A6CIH7_ZASCE|nr:uncharacterized protein M409DRAFT_55635 [Zasmidium cellare ATCC 36951]KAF2165762.1 hypothetical protein M409DRAFT_55635 [Zasmidium cellare ATCC 36951]